MTAKRVLIVEDDPFVAIDVQQALIEAGYEVCGSAASEAEALAIARSTHPEFAVVDVHLAPGDGRDVARQLIANYATSVLMATSECDDQLMASAGGARACLRKPYNADMIVVSLETAAALQAGRDPGGLPNGLVVLN